MSSLTLRTVIEAKGAVHLIGIGGISMRSLALVLNNLGCSVSGSDREDSPTLSMLQSKGIRTFVGHDGANIAGADFIVRTAAIPDDNCEMLAAVAAGIPAIERAEAWGILMQDYRHVVCVAGTHGKTSTTSMISTVALKANLDPTIMVGGELSAIGGSMRIGGMDYFVAEACEYKNSYHSFSPTIAVILNIDMDHVDFFPTYTDIEQSFQHFALQVPKENGVVIANYDDKRTMDAIGGIDRRIVTFGLSEEADIHASYIKDTRGFFSFSIYNKGAFYCDVKLVVPGRHNVSNTLASAAVAIELGLDGEAFKKGIEAYTGVGRRFEYKTTVNGARVFDDYSHHPKEIAVALAAADAMGDGRTICIFQPHTYTRTEALFEDFARALALADEVILAEIYSAREDNVHNTSSKLLAQKIPHSRYFENFNQIALYIKEIAQEGDIILTMGAGDIYKVCDLL